MTKQELENLLNSLRLKWKIDWGTDSSKWPKNNLDRRWWKFICDKSKGEDIARQIRKIDSGEEIKSADLTEDQLKDIFK